MCDSTKMGRRLSFPGKAAHFVSDLTTVFLNPISDKPSPKSSPKPVNSGEAARSQVEEEDANWDLVDGPDTSSFTAFLYSLLSSSETNSNPNLNAQNDPQIETFKLSTESGGKGSLFSNGKQSLSRDAARLGVHGTPVESNIFNKNDSRVIEEKNITTIHSINDSLPLSNLPDLSEPSLLLSEKTRGFIYASLPALSQGRKWVLLYSTWRHGISLSTLYRRSMLWPGLCLLVVGDRKGGVFGGLVEAPLRSTSKKKYQGSNNTFVFTDISGHPVVYHPTGANRYFTLCSPEFLALGGGGHFALYLDCDLLSGSSSVSETYGNSCLAESEDFDVKEVELWCFVYASKFEEAVALSRTEAAGIWRW